MNGQHVTSANQEKTYNALNKYAINLNERAESGKLDPVIGRMMKLESTSNLN